MTLAPIRNRRDFDEFDLNSAPPEESTGILPVTVQERYIQFRRIRLERTHQEALSDFMRNVGRTYKSPAEAMAAYFSRYKGLVAAAEQAYRAARQTIMNDRAMDYTRKQQALQRLTPGVESAWSQEREDGFIRVHGDPRQDNRLWNLELSKLDRETVEELLDHKVNVRNRTNWERVVPWLLANPDLDGSVSPCTTIQLVGAQRADDLVVTARYFAPPAANVVGPGAASVNAAYHEAMMKQARAICPHCLDSFPRGWRQHETACAQRHGHESVQNVSLPTDMPDILRQNMADGHENDEELEEEPEPVEEDFGPPMKQVHLDQIVEDEDQDEEQG